MAQMTLREARRFRRLTQDQLAEKSGVDQTHISSIEIGRRVPSDDVRARLAKALRFAPSKLRFTEPAADSETIANVDDRAGHAEATR